MKGHLIIAGGNIKSNDIYDKFVELSGGKNAKIAIIPTATVDAEEALLHYTKVFIQCGILEDKIVGIKVNPDCVIQGINNNDWKSCGDGFENLDFLDDVKGIWFTGGDQIRILKSFIRSDGCDTKLLKKIRDILEDGGVVGGSSAGAAIMSEVMIGGGTSFGALSMPIFEDYIEYRRIPEVENKGSLLIVKGLGFFKGGIVDQHFDKRNRIGRLAQTLYSSNVNMGYGVSENTAMVYDIEKGNLGRIGCGGVTIIDMSGSITSKIGYYSEIKNIKISYLEGNDFYNLNEDKFYLEDKRIIKETQYNAYRNYIENINANSSNDFNKIIGKVLFKNKEEELLQVDENNYLLNGRDVGFEIRLYNDIKYTREITKRNHSFIRAKMDILPIKLNREFISQVAE